MKKWMVFALGILFLTIASDDAHARRRSKKRRYSGPPPTHPVLLWSKTLSESHDGAQRKIAAFKLSQYSQNIFQDQVIQTILKCTKDEDMEIRVLCTKALGRAGTQSHTEKIRTALLDQYKEQEHLRNTVVRTFIIRKDNAPAVQETFMSAAKSTKNNDELMVLLSYFEQFGTGNSRFVDTLADIYKQQEATKTKRAVVKVMSERAEGQDKVIEILAQCAQSTDTPLALTCLSGLQVQAKKDARAWTAVEKTITSDDPDVLVATLDVINALPETPNPSLTRQLVRLIGKVDDTEIQEKAVLALGICGDSSEEVVKVLKAQLSNTKTDESVRIAAALILGRQGASFPQDPRALLTDCSKTGGSQSLRSACGLGLNELEIKAKAAPQKTPARETSSIEEPETDSASDDPEEAEDIEDDREARPATPVLRPPTKKESRLFPDRVREKAKFKGIF